MITDFKRRAQHALFFVPIKRIKASYPSQHSQLQESWVVERSTEYHPGFSGVMGIHYSHPPFPPKLEEWSVLFKTIPLQDIPPDFHECLTIHKIQAVSIGIAGALGPPPRFHRPFFGLPLLDAISLPVHLHCTFILADDRRSIRYDEKGRGNVESRFNKWLLTEEVPLFYFQFLANWNHSHPMEKCPWWPKKIEDPISKAVVMGMETILPTSNQLVCDTYSGHRIAPSKAHFLQLLCPRGLLLKLLPDDLAITPGFSYLSSPPLQNVDSNYLTAILRQKATFIISMYKEGKITVDDVVDVARFLKLSSLPDSLGLPLLPLADGTLASLSAEHTTFYCPSRRNKTPWIPFPPHHFLDPKAAEERDIYDLLRVQKLDNPSISRLITSTIPEEDAFSSSPVQEQWLEKLWDLFNVIPEVEIKHPAFEHLPLIPTYNSETPTRISFRKLAGSEVLFIKRYGDMPLDTCATLGMKLIMAEECRGKLEEAIESHKEWPSEIYRAIINFFIGLPSHQIPDCFQGLDRKRHLEFSQWFRKQLSGNCWSLTATEKATVQCLPLWETVQVGLRPARFVSANAAFVIPEGVDPGVVQTWTTGTTEFIPADSLLSFMKEPIALPTFYTDHLSFPPVMNPPTPTYKSLLEKVLRSSVSRPPILVPNANGRMVSSSELYLSSNTTFANAFASRNGAFLHPNLRDLEGKLCDWGLIHTITTRSFEACAEAIHQDIRRTDIHARALAVFHTYNTEMPSKLLGNHHSQRALQNLRFIPRHLGLTRYGSIPMDRYHSLPRIVSPSEILDPKFVKIAWTQRATCFEGPSTELQLVNNSTWEPGVSEVVCTLLFDPLFTSYSPSQIEHLRTLSTEIAPDLRFDSELIEDLKETYSWLAGRENEAGRLSDYNQEKLFLNVDNPVCEWSWNSASELLFDENDWSNPRRVKKFLRGYGGLLRAAGVREISHVSVPDNLLREGSHETQLTQIRSSFNEMREADQLTDVIFITEDGTEFTAHRVFLAAQIVHFKTSFAHGWSESSVLGEKVKVRLDSSRGCLEAVLGA